MKTREALDAASRHLQSLSGHIFDILSISKPVSPEAALNLAKVVSKLSPLLGNLIEFNAVEFLNEQVEFEGFGKWKRQDPGFPDTILEGNVKPVPGFEIKAWFPLATEMTGRFKDSQNRFAENNVYVCVPAWLPERLIYGRPYIVDVVVVDGGSVARSRDEHYHNPPDYLVVEPEDTAARTKNLQQTNTSGYKFQGTPRQFVQAERLVTAWGKNGRKYQPTRQYQQRVRELMARFPYRLDTNYAKIDRIAHDGLEGFKTRVCGTTVNGLTVAEWTRLFASMKDNGRRTPEMLAKNEVAVKNALAKHLEIKEETVEKLLE
jgi:hypothetical protein